MGVTLHHYRIVCVSVRVCVFVRSRILREKKRHMIDHMAERSATEREKDNKKRDGNKTDSCGIIRIGAQVCARVLLRIRVFSPSPHHQQHQNEKGSITFFYNCARAPSPSPISRCSAEHLESLMLLLRESLRQLDNIRDVQHALL